MTSPKGASNIVSLMESAWTAGVSKKLIRRFFPKVKSASFSLKFSNTIPFHPDDDFAVAVNGVFIHNTRQNIGKTQPPPTLYWKDMQVGDFVQVFTFDGWANGISHVEWSVLIEYDDAHYVTLSGGSGDTWATNDVLPNPLPSDYFNDPPKRSLYFPNGYFLIPPPDGWPIPAFFPQEFRKPTGSTRIPSQPAINPLF